MDEVEEETVTVEVEDDSTEKSFVEAQPEGGSEPEGSFVNDFLQSSKSVVACFIPLIKLNAILAYLC